MKVRNVLVVDFIVTKESRDIRFGKLKVKTTSQATERSKLKFEQLKSAAFERCIRTNPLHVQL